MPQNPVETTLFVSQIVGGSGATVTPDHGTGIVTIDVDGPTSSFASPPPIGTTVPNKADFTTVHVGTLTATELATFTTIQVGSLTATQLATFTTIQVGSLTATQMASLATVQVGGLTATQASSFTTVQVGALTATTLGVPATGTFTANGVTPVTVSNAAVTANSNILITLKTVGGTVGALPAIKTITPTTGFTVAGSASDTSVYNYVIIG